MQRFHVTIWMGLAAATFVLHATMHSIYANNTQYYKQKTTKPVLLTTYESQPDPISTRLPSHVIQVPVTKTTLFATPDSKSQPDLISTRIPSHVIQVPVTQTNLFATPKSESVRVASHVVQMPITQKHSL